ncbi:hypothetical protein ILUMI_25330 [Ignelater luminosus]|uniref:Uncharacterized protein n=1 Tax=Ignelater luminosus TaxID=2038154 RepID=A0A8K0C8R5_IGNLU|nr:hypothetical protein ILUMI_25330 [Ignelater luminosus]
MVCIYVRKTKKIDKQKTKEALTEIFQNKLSLREAKEKYKKCGLKRSRLGYLVNRAKEYSIDTVVFKAEFTHRQVISDNLENMLASDLLNCSNMFYGLSSKSIRKLAYEFAKRNTLRMSSSWDKNKEAGKD